MTDGRISRPGQQNDYTHNPRIQIEERLSSVIDKSNAKDKAVWINKN